MIRLTSLQLPLDHDEKALPAAIARKLGIEVSAITAWTLFKRSYDARRRHAVKLVYTVDIETPLEEEVLARFADDQTVKQAPDVTYKPPAIAADSKARSKPGPRPVIIGAGPCGLLAAVVLAEMGFAPLLLERGKKVRERTVDTFGFWRGRGLDPESNVQFGEGGAGTFSDGKLYSQIRDPRHFGRKVLNEFVAAGARPEILYESHPHLGTYRLVKMVENMRAKIESLGGEIRFRSKVDRLLIEEDAVRGVSLHDGEEIRADHVVLAVGHSARDTFEMVRDCGVFVEPKPFSIGLRIEHPQAMIDTCRFGRNAGHPLLGAAEYRLAHHCKGPGLEGRSVYSFCMCPGGTVVAAASEAGRVVTNGMSQHERAESNANAALVVDLTPERDFPGDPLAGIEMQRRYESMAYTAGGASYEAPGQLLGDFLARRASSSLGSVIPSYTPGVKLGDLGECLPDFVLAALREAIPVFDRKIRGFARDDAVFTGVETRTSSPIRIRRGDDGQSINTRGLFPAGEGAGYAGGILSAGVDGIRAAEAVVRASTAGTS